MDCLINMDVDDAYITVLQKIYTAHHSKHICCECNQPIKKGTEYERFVGKYEEDPQRYIYYTCIDCLSVRNAFFSDWLFTCLWDALNQEFEEGNIEGECLAKNLLKCTEKARADIAKIIERYNIEA